MLVEEHCSKRRNKAIVWAGKKAYPKIKSILLSRGTVTGLVTASAAGAATVGSVAISSNKIDDVERKLTTTTITATTTTTAPVPVTDDELEARINERLEELGVKIDTHNHPTTTHTHTSVPTTTTSTTVPVTTTSTVPPPAPPPPPVVTTTTTTMPPTTTTTVRHNDDPGDHDKGYGNDRKLIDTILGLLFKEKHVFTRIH